MRKLVLSMIAAGLFSSSGRAQTLFTFGDDTVTKQEFLRNYEKNSLNKKPDFSETALREYLNLYSLFRMKVKEAQIRKMDTAVSIQRELSSYRKQLTKNYLSDEVLTESLLKEAYNRMKEERHVAHILLLASPNASPEDSLGKFRLADSLYTVLKNKKASFEALAAKYSDDAPTREKGGDLGYITALQTLYPFENAAYSIKPGEVSKPFRTQFGYHIVKLIETRPSRGEVQVAQILITPPSGKPKGEGLEEARKKAESIEKELKEGAGFEALVKKYSNDRFTINEGGVMPPFGVGKMAPAFEDAAFALKKPGDVSKPVQTEFGYHIIKLIKKLPLQPYDSMKSEIKNLVQNDSRAESARDAYFQKIKEQKGFREYPENLQEVISRLEAIPDTGKNANQFQASDYKGLTKPLFSFAGNKYAQNDFIAFAELLTRGRLMGPKPSIVSEIYHMFVNQVINDYQESQLMDENQDFRNLMTEYREGIMLFELMDRNVWGKASRDSAGLKAFFDANKGKYQWEPGFRGTVYRFKNETALKEGLKMLNSRKQNEDVAILEKLNKDSEQASIQTGYYEFSKFELLPKEKLVKGKITAPVKNEDGSYSVVRVNETYSSGNPKTFEEARGYVIADYQDYLEKEWNKELRQKYPVKVEDGVLRAMVH